MTSSIIIRINEGKYKREVEFPDIDFSQGGVLIDLISLKVKCPVCHAHLMDKDNLIDNEPGVKLNIYINDKKGTIWLSSIYGSYNYHSDIDIPENEVGVFECPHCKSQIMSDKKCEECSSPLVQLNLLDGGKVHICSKAGCKNHSVEFQDINTALGHLYQDFSYHGDRTKNIKIIKRPEKLEKKELQRRDKEIIMSGTYLQSFCPHCKRSLIENNMLKFRIEKDNKEKGYLLLSPYLNIFSHKSTIRLPEKKKVKDIRCWHCDTSLIEKEVRCPLCNSEVAKIAVAAMSKMIDFYICSKKGCTWHGLSDEDLKFIMFEDSEEW